DIPDGGYAARQSCSQRADEVCMVHPGLDEVGRFAAQPLGEPEKPQGIRDAVPHPEWLNRNVQSSDLCPYGADVGQREHLRLEEVAINLRKQLEKHRLCAADGEAGDQMQDLDHNTLSRA